MIVEFCKWGNSLAVRIPKVLASLPQPDQHHDVGIHVGHRCVHVPTVLRPGDSSRDHHIPLANVDQLSPLAPCRAYRP